MRWEWEHSREKCFELFFFWIFFDGCQKWTNPKGRKHKHQVKKSRINMKQKTKRVVSFRAAVERVFWRAKKRSLSARSSLSSLVGKKNNSLSNSLEEKSIIFSTRASFFVSDSREKKKMFSSAQARSTMIGSSSSVRSTRSSSKVRSTTVRVRAMKGACNLFSSAFFF